MRKLTSYGVVSVLVILSFLLGGMRPAKADSAYTLVSKPDLSLKEIAEVSQEDIPSTLYGAGNIDCSTDSSDNCAVNTEYGAVYNSSLNVNGKWVPIKDYGGNSANFYAIPSSSTSITASFSPVFGANLYFTNSTYATLKPVYITPTGTPISGVNQKILSYFKLNHAPDFKLVDTAGNKLAADISSLAFSGNSKWVVVTDPGVATLAVNLGSGSVLPFGKVFIYGYGLNPVPKNAISSSGHYAAIATPDASTFTIYDLSSCGEVPEKITQPVNCQNRDLVKSGLLSSKIKGFSGVRYLRFVDDNSIVFYASYTENGATKYGKYILGLDSHQTNEMQYMALGDSYISGEGAFSYLEGTDTHDNKCHVSGKSYTALISSNLNFDSYHSVSCSGATTKDIIDTSDGYKGQAEPHNTRAYLEQAGLVAPILTDFKVGYIDQLDFVAQYHPKIMSVSIGGNDMGFSNILKSCIVPSFEGNTCYSTREDRLELVRLINNEVYPKLLNTYRAIKFADPVGAKIYVIGYPQIAKPGGDCALNVHLNASEITFSVQLIDYLDTIIRLAAQQAGVYYVDTQDALYGHRLCEAGPGEVAVNGLTAGNDTPSKFFGPIGDESYHPNQLGYQLLAEKILSVTDRLQAPMPVADLNVALPTESNLAILDAPAAGRTVQNLIYAPEMSEDSVYRGVIIKLDINGSDYSLTSGTTFRAELHSTPLALGDYVTSIGGNLSAQIYIPENVEVGYHTLHLIGQDVAGRTIDIYKYIYVGGAPEDIDGDGVADTEQRCVGIEPSGQDYDHDGIDDACDGFIGAAPASEIVDEQLLTLEPAQKLPLVAPLNSAPTSVSKMPESEHIVLGKNINANPPFGALPNINASSSGYIPALIVGLSITALIATIIVIKFL